MSDGNMEQKQQSNTGEAVERLFSGRVQCRVHGKTNEYRDAGKYTYRLVHTQESLRMLDLRLDIGSLEDVDSIGELLDGFGRRVLENAILFELEQLGYHIPRGIVKSGSFERRE